MTDYFFPANLSSYATLLQIPVGVEARITATVLTGAEGTTLRAVHATDHAAFAAGTYSDLTPAIDVSSEGFKVSEWLVSEEPGEKCVGIVAQTEGDVTSLVIGLAEVQLKST